ncbi:ABC-type amino acid transport substrate-binding protein [Roseibium hamelinense]|uniref:ABC-type amino acid transport substrate-binding protein n=1 Tax=Roseibium hamelinense TaxID=150831 RepID=A0A562SPY9_9HYPH|nr:transporter substrate-binding domain-containing protein [Roseibium hamelinense]MTI44032.1 transporter substrate-binding domain-containing protein [Roseibium hamelinense]TWI82760.1 ABC-type amino acid transport substrate-binding protein [Roseibium hamelinense]
MKLVYLALFGLVIVANPAHSQPIVLATDENYAPYSMPDLPGGGILNVLVSRVLEEAGYEPIIRHLPWSRALSDTENLKTDAVIGAYFTPERAKIFDYSEPFFSADMVLLARQDFPLKTVGSLSDLKGFRIGIVQDNAYPGGLLEADLNFNEVPDHRLNLRMLALGRADVVADLRERLRHSARQDGYNWSDFKVLEPRLGTGIMHIAVSKRHPQSEEIRTRFNAAFKTFTESGAYDELMHQAGFD